MNKLIGNFLVAMGLAKPVKRTQKRYDYSQTQSRGTLPKGFGSPTTTPVRHRTNYWRTARRSLGGLAVIGPVIALTIFQLGPDFFSEVPEAKQYFGSEKWIPPVETNGMTSDQKRAYWITAIQEMPCQELKEMLEKYDRGSVDSTARAFAAWEYANMERLFPSPRQFECYQESGYLKNDILRCADSVQSHKKCDQYFIPRDQDSKVISFPDDFFFVDVTTGNRYDKGSTFVHDYFPTLEKDWTINN